MIFSSASWARCLQIFVFVSKVLQPTKNQLATHSWVPTHSLESTTIGDLKEKTMRCVIDTRIGLACSGAALDTISCTFSEIVRRWQLNGGRKFNSWCWCLEKVFCMHAKAEHEISGTASAVMQKNLFCGSVSALCCCYFVDGIMHVHTQARTLFISQFPKWWQHRNRYQVKQNSVKHIYKGHGESTGKMRENPLLQNKNKTLLVPQHWPYSLLQNILTNFVLSYDIPLF